MDWIRGPISGAWAGSLEGMLTPWIWSATLWVWSRFASGAGSQTMQSRRLPREDKALFREPPRRWAPKQRTPSCKEVSPQAKAPPSCEPTAAPSALTGKGQERPGHAMAYPRRERRVHGDDGGNLRTYSADPSSYAPTYVACSVSGVISEC